MLSNGLGRNRLLRACALASAVVMVGCGGGDDNDVNVAAQATTTTAAPTRAEPVTTQGTSVSPTTSTPLTSGTRTPVSTTIPATPAEAMVTNALIVERTSSADIRPLSIDGVGYVSALQMYADPTPDKVEINASRARKRFLGTLGIPDDQKSTSSHMVEISLDGAAPIFSVIVNFGETKAIDLDVTDVLRIRITVSSKTRDSGLVAIGNPRFA